MRINWISLENFSIFLAINFKTAEFTPSYLLGLFRFESLSGDSDVKHFLSLHFSIS